MSSSFHGMPGGNPSGLARKMVKHAKRLEVVAPRSVSVEYVPLPSFVEHIPLRTRIATSTRNAWTRTKNFVLRRAA